MVHTNPFILLISCTEPELLESLKQTFTAPVRPIADVRIYGNTRSKTLISVNFCSPLATNVHLPFHGSKLLDALIHIAENLVDAC